MSGFLADINAANIQTTRQQAEVVVERIQAQRDANQTRTDNIAEQQAIVRQETQAFSPRLESQRTQDALSRLAFEDRLNSQTVEDQVPNEIDDAREEALANTAANPTNASDEVIQSTLPPGVGGNSSEFEQQVESSLSNVRSVNSIVGEGVNSILARAVEATEAQLAARIDPGTVDIVPDGPAATDIELQVFGTAAGDNTTREIINDQEIARQRDIDDQIEENFDRQLLEQEVAAQAYEARRLSAELAQQRLEEEFLREARFEASAERRINLEA